MTISFQNRRNTAVATTEGRCNVKVKWILMARMERKAQEARGRGQARSKAGRVKKLTKWFVAVVFQNSLHSEVSSEGVMICIYLEVLEQC